MSQNNLFEFQNYLYANQNLIKITIIFLSLLSKLILTKFFSLPIFFDVQTYLDTVNFFLSGAHVSDHIMPLYPIIVYIVEIFLNIQLFNIIISCLTIFLIFDLTKYIYDKILFRFIVILILSFYPFNIFYSITGFSETFYIFTLTLMLLLFYKDKIFYATIVGTIGVLIKPIHFYPLFILIFFFDYFYFKKNLKKTLYNFVLCILIFITLMTPWWIHNYKQYNKFIMFNLAAPHTLFIGNNPLNNSGGGVIIDDNDIKKFPNRFSEKHSDFSYDLLKGYPGFEYDPNKDKIVFTEGVNAALDRYDSYLEYSLNYIKNNPSRFIELSIKKFIRFWRLWPYSQEFNKLHYIIISIISFVPMVFLFSLYCIKYLKNFEKKTFPLILMIFYFNFVHMILISSIRYRFPIENFIIILAIYFGLRIYENSSKNKLI